MRRVRSVLSRRSLVDRLGKDFWTLWGSAVVSDFGDGVRLTAIPLLAAAVTKSPVAVAWVSFAGGLPWLVFALPAGAMIDRSDRLRVLRISQVLRFGVSGAFAAIVVEWSHPPIAVLAVVSFLLGIGEVFYVSASPALLPKLVQAEQLTRANSRLFGGQITANEFVGPPVGGALYGVSTALPFLADALTFLVSGLGLFRLRGDFVAESRRVRKPLRQEIRAGVEWVWANRLIRSLTLAVAVANLSRAMTMAIFVLFVTQVIHAGPVAYGAAFTAVAVGAVASSAVTPRVEASLSQNTVLVGSMLVQAASTLGLGFATDIPEVIVTSAVFGFVTMSWNITSMTIRQHIVPDEFRGRVFSSQRLLTWGALPVGSLLGGGVAAAGGLRAPFIAGGIGILVGAGWLWRELNQSRTDTTPENPHVEMRDA